MIQPQEATERPGEVGYLLRMSFFSSDSSFDGFLFGHFQYQEYNFFLITTPSFVGSFLDWMDIL